MAGISILAVGDPHFKTTNCSDTDNFSKQIIDLVTSRRPDVVVLLGDILDRHEHIHEKPLNRCVKFIETLTTLVAPGHLAVLVGNHDRPNNSVFLTDEHPFRMLKGWDSKPIVADVVKTLSVSGHKLVFAPYVPPGRFTEALDTITWRAPYVHPGRFTEALDTITWRDAKVIFAHQEFFGAKMGAVVSEVGDKWPLDAPFVISGHIHDYDELQSNIIYTGTPTQHAFGDKEEKSVSWITVGDVVKHERIFLNIIKKRTVTVTAQEITSFQLPENCELRLTITGTPAEIKAVSRLELLKTFSEKGVKISYKADSKPLSEESRRVVRKYNMTFFDILRSQIQAVPELIELFNEIVTEIKT
jgi:DNA repair exonuclease SbcCD nuclease subunit